MSLIVELQNLPIVEIVGFAAVVFASAFMIVMATCEMRNGGYTKN